MEVDKVRFSNRYSKIERDTSSNQFIFCLYNATETRCIEKIIVPKLLYCFLLKTDRSFDAHENRPTHLFRY